VENGNIGFGSAASTSLFLLIMLCAVLFIKAAKVNLGESAK
jgi:trehalose/maltose transport system permease protein